MDAHLKALEDQAKSIASTPETGTQPGLTSVEARADRIAQLQSLYIELQRLVIVVARCGAEAEAIQRRELHVVQERLSRIAHIGHASPSSVPDPDPGPDPDADLREIRDEPKSRQKTVRLTPSVSLRAIIISGPASDISSKIAGSDIYYIPAWNHFAFRVGPILFHGNIGKIFDGGRAPRIKDCRHAHCSRREDDSCTYYHDPETHPGSRDVRNYTSISRNFAPITSRHTAQSGTRRFGSRDSLDMDIANITPQDANRFLDQVAHDLLCAIAISQAGIVGKREKD